MTQDADSHDPQRRRLTQAVAAGTLLSAFGLHARETGITPGQTAGPFFPRGPVAHDDADLLQRGKTDVAAAGEPLELSGLVVSADNRPIPTATVEIWQCDATGHYHHPEDRPGEARDGNFQGYGRTQTDAGGGYRFRTIVPVPYPGRTPHVHFRVTAPGRRSLTTQMYIAGHSDNRRDFLYRRLSPEAQRLLSVHLAAADNAGKQGYFRIVLA